MGIVGKGGVHVVDEDKKAVDRAVLVALITNKRERLFTLEYLDELEFLAETIGIQTIAKSTQELAVPDKRTFIGKGKVEEIKTFIEMNDISTVIFDDDLSPSQLRNVETELGVKIYDRSLLILDIFMYRAKTAQAKVQVELARAQYMLPRLTRMWTHLERQRGGTGTRGGAGEQEIETDKRNVRDTIHKLKQRLEKIEKQSKTQRKGREQMTRVSLVGYTNVGKSSLMRVLSKSDVFAEDKLFATVDSTVRKVAINTIPFLLSDTVGFIRKLPTTLIECFKSTLDEVREADILMHIVDLSHPFYENQIEVVENVLAEIGAANKPTLLVFNKIDEYEKQEDSVPIATLREKFNQTDYRTVFVSATEGRGLDSLRQGLFDFVADRHFEIFPNYKSDFYEYYNNYLKPEEKDEE